jgi:dTDP-D-glucose 4,6-dehydratase
MISGMGMPPLYVGVRLWRADIADVLTLAEVVRRYEISTVMHFAASAYVGESVCNPPKYFANNLKSHRNAGLSARPGRESDHSVLDLCYIRNAAEAPDR